MQLNVDTFLLWWSGKFYMLSNIFHNASTLASSQTCETHQTSTENYSGHDSRHHVSVETHLVDIWLDFSKLKNNFSNEHELLSMIHINIPWKRVKFMCERSLQVHKMKNISIKIKKALKDKKTIIFILFYIFLAIVKNHCCDIE